MGSAERINTCADDRRNPRPVWRAGSTWVSVLRMDRATQLRCGLRPAARLISMFGLYALKPWYASRLGGVRRMLATRGISPNAVTLAGVGFGATTGVAFFVLRPGPWAAVVVAVLLAARLACANLDGGLARETG